MSAWILPGILVALIGAVVVRALWVASERIAYRNSSEFQRRNFESERWLQDQHWEQHLREEERGRR
jgi:hypothetical protein